MAHRHTPTCIKTLNEEKAERAAFEMAVRLLFTERAEAGAFTDEALTTLASVLPLWIAEDSHEKGCIRRCPECGDLFRCVEPPPAPRARTTPKPPSKAPDYWQPIVVSE